MPGFNSNINNNSNGQPYIINTGSGNTVVWVIGGVAALGAAWYFKSWWDDYKMAQLNKKAATDPNANIASQIYSENRATYTEDNKVIDLFRQIRDFNAVNALYKDTGKDLLIDTRKHVSSGAYQQILNIIGIKSGAVSTTSDTSQQATSTAKYPQWLISKTDVRLRKSPKAGSAVFTLRPNVISTVRNNMIVGFVDHAAIKRNGGKLYYDDENSVFFIPVLVFDAANIKKTYPAYIASSAVYIEETNYPKNKELLRISSWTYNTAYAT